MTKYQVKLRKALVKLWGFGLLMVIMVVMNLKLKPKLSSMVYAPQHFIKKIHQMLFSFICFICLGFLCRCQHCTGHITTGSWKGIGNQYIQLVKVLYCKLPTNGKQLPAFPLEVEP